MKKIISIISIIILLICSIIVFVRHAHIEYVDTYDNSDRIRIEESAFFEAPKGKWLDLSDEMYMNGTHLFVDGYNHLFCTWDNTYNMYTHWAYKIEKDGPPYLLSVIEKDIYHKRTYANPVDYIYYGEVDGLKISYDYLNDSIYIKIESKTRTIELDIYKEHKEVLEKVVLRAIDVLKD